jgi:hypothetical protein
MGNACCGERDGKNILPEDASLTPLKIEGVSEVKLNALHARKQSVQISELGNDSFDENPAVASTESK